MDISIIIPAHNAALYLEECLQSCILSASYAKLDVELIVIDDGSTDATAQIAARMAPICQSQQQQGAAAARNAGIALAKGDFVFFQDADDLISKEALSILYNVLMGQDTAHMAAALATDFISPNLTFEEQQQCKARQAPYAGTMPGTMLIQRQVFERVGVFDTSLATGETVDWLVRAQDMGVHKVQLDAVTLLRRLHPQSTGAMHKSQERKDYLAILRKRHAKKT